MPTPLFDHISLAVTDLDRAAAFYDAALAPLGVTRQGKADHRSIAWGRTGDDFGLHSRAQMTAPPHEVHVCFTADTREAVRAFHSAGIAAGGSDDGAPGLRPEYSPVYYAAFLQDPDGNRIEAVTRAPEA